MLLVEGCDAQNDETAKSENKGSKQKGMLEIDYSEYAISIKYSISTRRIYIGILYIYIYIYIYDI